MLSFSGLVGYILVLHASRVKVKVTLKFFVESMTSDEEKVQIAVNRLTRETQSWCKCFSLTGRNGNIW